MTACTPSAIKKIKNIFLALIISTLYHEAVSKSMLTLALCKSRMVLNQNILKLKPNPSGSTAETLLRLLQPRRERTFILEEMELQCEHLLVT